jgi:predicted outer membrane repeat protein
MTGPPIEAGGIANGGTAVITGSEVENNTATTTSGAGIVNHGTMAISWSAVNHNTAAGTGATASGGGIVNASVGAGTDPPSGVLTINFSQVNGNSAGGFGGGILNGLPSPVMPSTGTLTISHSQVSGNSAAKGGGGIYSVTGGAVSLKFTIVSGNHPDNCEPLASIAGCTG